MTLASEAEAQVPGATSPPGELRRRVSGAAHGTVGALKSLGSSASAALDRVPATVNATRDGVRGTARSLQTLPDTTLRSLAATSLGVGAGFYLARAPRLAIAAGLTPALVMGAAMVLRPIEPDVEDEVATPTE